MATALRHDLGAEMSALGERARTASQALATVPREYDPVALRELFSPGFLAWTTTMTGEIDFGVNDRQLWFLWHLRERSEAELKEALANAGQLFRRLQAEMEESGIHTYRPGPWHAGLEPFPGD